MYILTFLSSSGSLHFILYLFFKARKSNIYQQTFSMLFMHMVSEETSKLNLAKIAQQYFYMHHYKFLSRVCTSLRFFHIKSTLHTTQHGFIIVQDCVEMSLSQRLKVEQRVANASKNLKERGCGVDRGGLRIRNLRSNVPQFHGAHRRGDLFSHSFQQARAPL